MSAHAVSQYCRQLIGAPALGRSGRVRPPRLGTDERVAAYDGDAGRAFLTDSLDALDLLEEALRAALRDSPDETTFPDLARAATTMRWRDGSTAKAEPPAKGAIPGAPARGAAATPAPAPVAAPPAAPRFVLDDPALTRRVKEVRHRLAEAVRALDPQLLINSRDTPGDVGTHIMTVSERMRENPRGVLTANFKRAAEAIRSEVRRLAKKLSGPGVRVEVD